MTDAEKMQEVKELIALYESRGNWLLAAELTLGLLSVGAGGTKTLAVGLRDDSENATH